MAQDNEYCLGAVPAKGRKGVLSLMLVMLGLTFFSASMWAGATLGNFASGSGPTMVTTYDAAKLNAQSLTREGAALLLPQAELTAEGLARQVADLNGKREQLTGMAQAARRVAILNATERVAAVCRELVNDERRA